MPATVIDIARVTRCPQHAWARCVVQDLALGPCAGTVRGYYVDNLLYHVCTRHFPVWSAQMEDLPEG